MGCSFDAAITTTTTIITIIFPIYPIFFFHGKRISSIKEITCKLKHNRQWLNLLIDQYNKEMIA